MYDYETFDNFEQFKQSDEVTATELLEIVGEGDWMNKDLIVYETLEDYAIYEVEEGIYSGDRSFDKVNGAPDILDFIDYDALGEALRDSWDDSCYIYLNGQVISTNHGW